MGEDLAGLMQAYQQALGGGPFEVFRHRYKAWKAREVSTSLDAQVAAAVRVMDAYVRAEEAKLRAAEAFHLNRVREAQRGHELEAARGDGGPRPFGLPGAPGAEPPVSAYVDDREVERRAMRLLVSLGAEGFADGRWEAARAALYRDNPVNVAREVEARVLELAEGL